MNITVGDLELYSNRTVFVRNNASESLVDFLHSILNDLACPTDYNDYPVDIYFGSVDFELSNGLNSLEVSANGNSIINAGDTAEFGGFSFTQSDVTRIDDFENLLVPETTLYIDISVKGVAIDEADEQETTSANMSVNVKRYEIDKNPSTPFYSESNPLMIPSTNYAFNPSFTAIDLKRYTGLNSTTLVKSILNEADIPTLNINYEYVKNEFNGAGLYAPNNAQVIYEFNYPDDEDSEILVTLKSSYSVWVEAQDPVYDINIANAKDVNKIEANYQGSIPRGSHYEATFYFKKVFGAKPTFKITMRGVDITSTASDFVYGTTIESVTVNVDDVDGDIVITSELVPDVFVRWYDHNQPETTYRDFEIKEGYTIEENFNEELDNATVVIRTTKTNFEPMDFIEFCEFNRPYRLMMISNIVENKVNIVNYGEDLYDYQLMLCSLTKALERITLPSFSYTKPFEENRKKISDVIGIILNDYSPKIIVNGTKQSLYNFYSTFSFIYNTECPDMVFENMTLREALDQVLSVVNCICTVRWERVYNKFTIEAMWLNDQYGELTDNQLSHFQYPQENQSIEDYASETENNIHNIVPKLGTDNYTKVTEYLTFRNEEGVQVTTENMYLQTNYPIYDIDEFEIIQFRSNSDDDPDTPGDESENECYNMGFYIGYKEIMDAYNNWDPLHPFDIFPLGICEQQEYQLFPYVNRRYIVRYSRGNNKIIGWGDKYPVNPFGDTQPIWYYITLLARDVIPRSTANPNFFDTFGANVFKLSYYTLTENVRIKSGKLLPEPHQSTIVNNQSEGFVDMALQGTNFQDKVNRLGNRCKIWQGRFNKEDEIYIPHYGTSYNNYVVISVSKTYYNNFIAVKLTLTENYVNINYFTGINARKRSWNLVSINETVNKQLLDKWYCEFDFTRGTRTSSIDQWNGQVKFINNYLLTVFKGDVGTLDTFYLPTYAFIRTYDTYGHGSGGNPWLQVELNRYVSGRSIVFHFKSYDNFAGGKFLPQADAEVEAENYSEIASSFQNWARYTKDNGELTQNKYQIAIIDSQFKAPNLIVPEDGELYTDDEVFGFLDYTRIKPLTYLDQMGQSNLDKYAIYVAEINNHKDSKETIEFNIQFEYCSATSDIIVTPVLASRCRLVNSENLPTLKSYLSKRNHYLNDKYYYRGEDLEVTCEYIITERNKSSNNEFGIQIRNINEIDEQYKSLVITQVNSQTHMEEIVMVINNVRQHTTGPAWISLYLNMYRGDRDHKNYTTADMKNWTI